MIFGYLAMALLGVAAVIFAVANPEPVAVSFLDWRTVSLPLSFVILVSAFVGVVFASVSGFAEQIRLKRMIHKYQTRQQDLEARHRELALEARGKELAHHAEREELVQRARQAELAQHTELAQRARVLHHRGEEGAMGMFKVLSHVSITVTDIAKAREFYTGQLGLQEIPRPAFDFPGIWYSLGGELQLHIILNDQLVRPAVEREKIVARYPHFALWTDDADATATRLEALGQPLRDVISGPTGLRQVFIKDPDGNMVEFLGPSKSAGARRMEA